MQAMANRTPIPFYKDWLLIPVIGLVYLLDQLTKFLVEERLCYGQPLPAEGTFQLKCSFNTGAAFGLFVDHTFLLIIASFIGVGVLLYIYRLHPAHGLLLRISLGLQLGGAIGNLTDRIRFGQVTDFVKLGPWPIFNVADACIVVGIIILIALFFLNGDKEPDSGQSAEEYLYTPSEDFAEERTASFYGEKER